MLLLVSLVSFSSSSSSFSSHLTHPLCLSSPPSRHGTRPWTTVSLSCQTSSSRRQSSSPAPSSPTRLVGIWYKGEIKKRLFCLLLSLAAARTLSEGNPKQLNRKESGVGNSRTCSIFLPSPPPPPPPPPPCPHSQTLNACSSPRSRSGSRWVPRPRGPCPPPAPPFHPSRIPHR